MRELLDSAAWRVGVAVAAIAIVLGVGFAAWHAASSPSAAEAVAAEAARARGHATLPAAPDAATATKARPLLVFVSGSVANPGTYQLPRGSRIADAIAAAGGLLPDADPNKLPNLAGKLTDGKQVKVPRRGATAASAARVDINSATVEELVAVPGMDQPLAEAIVNEREGYGPFTTLTELHTLLGLDTQYVSALRPYLKVVAP
ncbi:MAG TPA: helix-hairpin-helix domain-containing protein [Candidatus Dormibacteraeota bacterium]